MATTGETIIKITQPNSVDSTVRVKSSPFLSSYPSLTQSDRFDKHPSPRLVFLSWYRNSRGVSSKTRLNGGHISYLRRAIRHRSYDTVPIHIFKNVSITTEILFLNDIF